MNTKIHKKFTSFRGPRGFRGFRGSRGSRGSIDWLLLIPLVVLIPAVLSWVFADNLKIPWGKLAAKIQGQSEYQGAGPTRVTRARSRPRGLHNFDDARIRQDQYNRNPKLKKSRKTKGDHDEDF